MSLGATQSALAILSAAFQRPSSAADAVDAVVFDAAIECIGRHGPQRTTVDDIAALASVGRATLFRRYGSKEELLRRAVAYGCLRLYEQLTSIEIHDDPVARLVELTIVCAELLQNDALIHGLVRDSEFGAVMADGFVGGVIRGFAEKELRRVAPRDVSDADVAVIAEALIRFLVSVVVMPALGGKKLERARMRAIAASILGPLQPSSRKARP